MLFSLQRQYGRETTGRETKIRKKRLNPFSLSKENGGNLISFFLFFFEEDLSGKTAEVRKSCTFHLLIAFSDIGEKKKEKEKRAKMHFGAKRKKVFFFF